MALHHAIKQGLPRMPQAGKLVLLACLNGNSIDELETSGQLTPDHLAVACWHLQGLGLIQVNDESVTLTEDGREAATCLQAASN